MHQQPMMCHCPCHYYVASQIPQAYCYRCSSVICLSVCLSVCCMVTTVSLAKTTEPIEMWFGAVTRMGPRNDGGANRRHLTNTIEKLGCTSYRETARTIATVLIGLLAMNAVKSQPKIFSIKKSGPPANRLFIKIL